MLEDVEVMIDGIESSSSLCDRIGRVSGLSHNMPITRPWRMRRGPVMIMWLPMSLENDEGSSCG